MPAAAATASGSAAPARLFPPGDASGQTTPHSTTVAAGCAGHQGPTAAATATSPAARPQRMTLGQRNLASRGLLPAYQPLPPPVALAAAVRQQHARPAPAAAPLPLPQQPAPLPPAQHTAYPSGSAATPAPANSAALSAPLPDGDEADAVSVVQSKAGTQHARQDTASTNAAGGQAERSGGRAATHDGPHRGLPHASGQHVLLKYLCFTKP